MSENIWGLRPPSSTLAPPSSQVSCCGVIDGEPEKKAHQWSCFCTPGVRPLSQEFNTLTKDLLAVELIIIRPRSHCVGGSVRNVAVNVNRYGHTVQGNGG